MKSAKLRPVRTILAWVVGILVGLFLHAASTRLLDDVTVPDSIAGTALMILCYMIGARAGMAIYASQLNGGVSRDGNSLFFRWAGAILLLGITGALTELLLDMMLDSRWFKILIVALLLNGLGLLLLVKWRLLRK
jgi:hypothetical protein